MADSYLKYMESFSLTHQKGAQALKVAMAAWILNMALVPMCYKFFHPFLNCLFLEKMGNLPFLLSITINQISWWILHVPIQNLIKVSQLCLIGLQKGFHENLCGYWNGCHFGYYLDFLQFDRKGQLYLYSLYRIRLITEL